MYDVRSRYLADSVATVTPAKLLTMLYDRLVLDIDRAEAALHAGDRGEATTQLNHAQDIVAELISSLNVGAWTGAPGLMSIYSYLLSELIETNMTADAARAVVCRDLVVPLRDAWHGAADALAHEVPTQRSAPTFPGAVSGSVSGELGIG